MTDPRRSTRIARWTAFGTTLLFGVYVAVRLRAMAPAWRAPGRTIAAMAVVVWYYLTYRIVKHITAALSLVGLLTATAAAQTSLSIYSDGRVVVRRTLPQALAKGRTRVTLQLVNVDPATVFSPDSSVTVVSAVQQGPTTRAAALESAEGQTLSFVRAKGDTVRATVVRAMPPQYRLPDGRFLLVEPGEPLFPAELVRGGAEVALVLEATRARPATDLAYLTQGAQWSAAYQVLLTSGGIAWLSGSATVMSQGLSVDSATVQLVAGTISRATAPHFAPLAMGVAARQMAVAEEPASEEAVGESHVYTLPARVSLAPGVSVTTALFPRTTAAVTQEYVISGVLPYRGFVPNAGQGEPNRVPVQSWYTLKRARGTPFGDRPLPGGVVDLYQADSAGRVQLIGESESAHQPVGRDLRVLGGAAFDITAERVLTDYAQEQIPPARKGLAARQRSTASYRVTISNAKAVPVVVDVREVRAGVWSVVTSSVPPDKLSATEVRFRVTVPARGDATLTYTVQVDT